MTRAFPAPSPLDSEFGAAYQSGKLPHRADAMVGAAAAAIGLVLWLGLGVAPVGALVLAWIIFAVAQHVWSRVVEGRRKATDRTVTTLVWSVFAIALIPLVWVSWVVISKGAGAVTADFLTKDLTGVTHGGGMAHALVGTLLVTVCATVISVPIGVMSAIYLVEYGGKNGLSRAVTFLVDVMTGIPSIVAGLFAFAAFTLIFGPGTWSGLAGAVALSLLMVPTVVRATEEMLKLVPPDLREASWALGVPKWRTIVKIVLPTALGGIAAGITLAIARVAGETAPLLIAAGSLRYMNWNPFDGKMETIPVYIFTNVSSGGLYADEQTTQAWGAALVLIVIVMSLNLLARIVGKIFAPKTGR